MEFQTAWTCPLRRLRHPTAQMSVDCVKNCGRVIWVGNADQMVSINMQNVVTRELHLRGSYAFTDEDFPPA